MCLLAFADLSLSLQFQDPEQPSADNGDEHSPAHAPKRRRTTSAVAASTPSWPHPQCSPVNSLAAHASCSPGQAGSDASSHSSFGSCSAHQASSLLPTPQCPVSNAWSPSSGCSGPAHQPGCGFRALAPADLPVLAATTADVQQDSIFLQALLAGPTSGASAATASFPLQAWPSMGPPTSPSSPGSSAASAGQPDSSQVQALPSLNLPFLDDFTLEDLLDGGLQEVSLMGLRMVPCHAGVTCLPAPLSLTACHT